MSGKKVLLIFVVVVVVSLTITLSSLGFIIKKGVNQMGPGVTQTKVFLKDAKLSLLSGSAAMEGLIVGNPEGSVHENALELANLSVDLDAGSVFEDVIIINEIVIDGLEVSWEGLRGENIKKIQANVEEFTGKREEAIEKQKQENEKTAEPKKLKVAKILIKNTKLKLAGFGQGVTVPLPPLTLENIGNADGGASPAEVFDAILKAVITDGPAVIKEHLSKIGDAGKEILKKGGETVKGVGEKAKETGKKLLEGIGL